jgi:DNA-binding CsgD family transcriptional regulator
VSFSERLKGKDYRDLLEIIDFTYGASCPDALFPPLFEKLAKAIGCHSAVYMPVGGAGLPKWKARGATVLETNSQVAREYAECYWALDPFNITGTKEANRAARETDLIPASKYMNSEFAVDFAARVPCAWGLAGTVGSPGHPVGVIALHRLRHDHDFSDRDVAFVRALLPHLSRALLFFEERSQRPRATGILILDDLGTVVYSNDAASHILREKSAESIRLPISQQRTTYHCEQGNYAVSMQSNSGRYKVVSLEPMRHDRLPSRFAAMGLTPRQQEIASRVLWGASNKHIANELDVTEQTVRDHLSAVFRKLGIHHRAELAARILPLALNEIR